MDRYWDLTAAAARAVVQQAETKMRAQVEAQRTIAALHRRMAERGLSFPVRS